MPQTQARAVAFRGSCVNNNRIIKFYLSQRKRENDLAAHWDDAALPMWFLQTTIITLLGCLSYLLLTICLTLWPIRLGRTAIAWYLFSSHSLVTLGVQGEMREVCRGSRALQFSCPGEHMERWAGVHVVGVGTGKGTRLSRKSRSLCYAAWQVTCSIQWWDFLCTGNKLDALQSQPLT